MSSFQRSPIDLTSQPLPQAERQLDPSSLVLERYTKEAERLSQQAQPTSQLARSLQESVRHMQQFVNETRRLPDLIGALSRSIQNAIAAISPRGISPAAISPSQQVQSILPAVVAATAATVVARTPSAALQLPGIEDRISRAVITGARHRDARVRATRSGLDLGIATEEEIRKAKIGIGEGNISSFLEERARRPFVSKEDVLGRKLGVRKDAISDIPEPTILPEQSRLLTLEREAKLLEARKNFLTNPNIKETMREEATLQQRVTILRRSVDWQQQVNQYGEMGARLRVVGQRARGAFESLSGIASLSSISFAFGGILGAVSQADPITYQTFKASVQGAAGAIGQIFIPTVQEASRYIQAFEDTIDAIDPATKRIIERTVRWTLVIGGGIAAIATLTGALRILGVVMSAGALTGPGALFLGIGIALAGLITAVGIATDGFGLLKKRADEAAGAVGGVGRAGAGLSRPGEASARDILGRMGELPRNVQENLMGAGGDVGRMREILSRHTESARQREEEARESVRRALGEETGRRTERLAAEEVIGFARTRYTELARKAQDEAARLGGGPVVPLSPASRARFEEQAAREAATPGRLSRYAAGIAPSPAVIRRVLAMLRGEDPDVAAGAPRIRPFQAELERRTAERERAERMAREFGATDGLRLSTRGLFPQAQVHSDFAKLGEQIQLKVLERPGEEDIRIELRKISNMMATLGSAADIVTAINTQTFLYSTLGPASR